MTSKKKKFSSVVLFKKTNTLMRDESIRSFLLEKEQRAKEMRARVRNYKNTIFSNPDNVSGMNRLRNSGAEKQSGTRADTHTESTRTTGVYLLDKLRTNIQEKLDQIEIGAVQKSTTRSDAPERRYAEADTDSLDMFGQYFAAFFNGTVDSPKNMRSMDRTMDLIAPGELKEKFTTVVSTLGNDQFAALMEEIKSQKKASLTHLKHTDLKQWEHAFEENKHSLLTYFEMLKGGDENVTDNFLLGIRSLNIEVKNITEKFRNVTAELLTLSEYRHNFTRKVYPANTTDTANTGEFARESTGMNVGEHASGAHEPPKINFEVIQLELEKFLAGVDGRRIRINNLAGLKKNYPKKIPSKSIERIFIEFKKNAASAGMEYALLQLIENIPYEFILVPYKRIAEEIKTLTAHENDSFSRAHYRQSFDQYLTVYHLYGLFNEFNVWYKKLLNGIFFRLFEAMLPREDVDNNA